MSQNIPGDDYLKEGAGLWFEPHKEDTLPKIQGVLLEEDSEEAVTNGMLGIYDMLRNPGS